MQLIILNYLSYYQYILRCQILELTVMIMNEKKEKVE